MAEEATIDKKAEKDSKPQADESKLSATAKKILDDVGKMSVLELADLVKVMEDKFGVSAAAPVAVAVAGPGAGGDAATGGGDANVTVTLESPGGSKINVIKAVRELLGLGLKEAKDLVDAAPSPIKESVPAAEAEEVKKKLEEAGATVKIG